MFGLISEEEVKFNEIKNDFKSTVFILPYKCHKLDGFI